MSTKDDAKRLVGEVVLACIKRIDKHFGLRFKREIEVLADALRQCDSHELDPKALRAYENLRLHAQERRLIQAP